MDLCNEKDIRALLGRHGFRFSKSMGQNFLIEGWVPRDIAEASGAGPDTGVLEIGPGIGPLTVQLARRAAKVAAIELDRTLYPILAETLAPYPNAEVVPGDAMKLDLAALVSDKFSGLTAIACANLPYNITTPVLTALIEAGCFASITCASAPPPVPAIMGRSLCSASITPSRSCSLRWGRSASSPPPRSLRR